MAPPAARVLPSRVFYGWYVAFGCMVMQFVTVGVGYYGLQVFLKPLRDEHGWSASVVSSASAMFFAVSGVSSFIVGRYLDRRGPKPFIYAGIVLISSGTIALGHVHAIWQLFACYAVMPRPSVAAEVWRSARCSRSGSSPSGQGPCRLPRPECQRAARSSSPWARRS